LLRNISDNSWIMPKSFTILSIILHLIPWFINMTKIQRDDENDFYINETVLAVIW
jgi:competence protein ComGF